VVCATAFGIDKSNVRWVIHYNLPKNIEDTAKKLDEQGRDVSTIRKRYLFERVMADLIYCKTGFARIKTLRHFGC
jgi:superfamily II DNA helicase RecQ